jgi:hypothetical protein
MEKECIKCGHPSKKIKLKFGELFCDFCFYFAPDKKEEMQQYILEKVNHKLIETYRKQNKLAGFRQKKGMIKKAKEGKVMNRCPFGYVINDGNLFPAENSIIIEEIFLEYNETELSLNRFARKWGFSINGMKKILTNFTYLGKIKFNKEIHSGNHIPLISSTIFNHVQDKLERLKIKKP